MYSQMCTGTHVGQQRASDPMELELQAVVNHSRRVLGPELGSSERAASAFSHWAISAACMGSVLFSLLMT